MELAGALAEIAHDTLRHDFRSIRPEERAHFPDRGRAARAAHLSGRLVRQSRGVALARLNVTPRTGVFVTHIDDRGVTVKAQDGTERTFGARTVIWAAGVAPSSFAEVLERRARAPRDRKGQVLVNPDCSVPGHPEIFVIGDLAHFEQDGKPLPGVAQVAMQQGAYVAKLIPARLRRQDRSRRFIISTKAAWR